MNRQRLVPLMLAIVAIPGAALFAFAQLRSKPEPAYSANVVSGLSGGDTTGFARAIAPRAFVFPLDHGAHPAFQTEWWYYHGNLATPDGRRFGFELTIFAVP